MYLWIAVVSLCLLQFPAGLQILYEFSFGPQNNNIQEINFREISSLEVECQLAGMHSAFVLN